MRAWIVSIILFLVGVLNLAPVIVSFNPASTIRLYGVELVGEDLAIMIRHRGVLLGLLGAALIYAAFRRDLVVPAIAAAIVGKLAFLFLVWTAANHSPEIGQVAAIDIAAVVLLLIAAAVHFTSK